VLHKNGGNKAKAAETLGIGTATLFRKLKRYEARA
jgi:DNA-binding protein Fis